MKIAALLLAHLTGRRLIGVFLDPVTTCNLRCKMCHMSGGAGDRPVDRIAPDETVETFRKVARALFSRALKLQIGCAYEPTLFRNLPDIVTLGKEYGIPYISLTTNGQLLDRALLMKLVDAGLDEVTLSLHGTRRDTYEHLMTRARYDRFLALLDTLAHVQRLRPALRLRINYTLNNINTAEVADMPGLFKDVRVDVLQLRPVQNLGDSEYKDFSHDGIMALLDSVVRPVVDHFHSLGTTCLYPTPESFGRLASEEFSADNIAEDVTYCYVSPRTAYKEDFHPATDTYESYHRRAGTVKALLRSLLEPSAWARHKKNSTTKLNYKLK